MGRALVSIAGYDLPNPSTYVGTEATIVDSARNVQGVVVGAVVRESVAKVELSYKYLEASAWATIMQKFNSTYGGNFYNNVTFFNQLTNDWTTRKMYINDRTTGGAFKLDSTTGKVIGYTDCAIHLIEV